ncbi:MAG: iron-regulated protein, partial [Bacteroidetes bacterium]
KLWNNYATDYRPVVELCRSAGVPFVAGNVPRTYARLVSRQGAAALDTLPAEEKALLCPLPYPIDYQLPAYAAMRDMFAGHGGGMNPDNFIAAQALKDATMAWRLLAALSSGKQALHLNGSYHSDFHEGMVWYLQHYRPGIRVLTLSVVEQEDLDRLDTENLKRADFIIVVPAKMTKTYLTED